MSVAFTGDRPPAVATPGSRARLVGVPAAPMASEGEPEAVTLDLRLLGHLEDDAGETPFEDDLPTRAGAREDADLVMRCRRGDADAYAALFRRWYPRCRAAAARVLTSRGLAADAEDLAQEALAIAWSRLDQLRDLPSFGPWVCRIARNLALDHAKRRRPAFEAIETLVDDHEALVVDAADPQRVLADLERDRLVRVAAGSLKGRDEQVFERLVDDGLTPAEVAQALGVSDNHAYQILFRLRNRMQSGLRAALVWRQGRPRCTDLADLLPTSGEFTAATAETVVRHLRRCQTCADLADEHATPAHLLSGFVAVLWGRLPHGLLRARAEDAVLGTQGVDVVVRVVAGVGVATTLTTGVLAVTGLPGQHASPTVAATRAAAPLVAGAPSSTSRPQRTAGAEAGAGAQGQAVADPCSTALATGSGHGRGSQVVQAAAGRPARGKGQPKQAQADGDGKGAGRGARGRAGQSQADSSAASQGDGTACDPSSATTSAGAGQASTTASSATSTTGDTQSQGQSQGQGQGRGHGQGRGADKAAVTPGVGRGHAKPHPTPGHGRDNAATHGRAGRVAPAATSAATSADGGSGTGSGAGASDSQTPTGVGTVTVTVTASPVRR